jgi:DNA-binding SARP family transcriptional activator
LVLISTRPISAAEQAILAAELGDPGHVGVVIVAPGTLQGASWQLVATADGQLEVRPLSRHVQAQRVSTTHLAGIAALLGLAARRGDVASDAAPYGTIASTGSSSTDDVRQIQVLTTVPLEGDSEEPSIVPGAQLTPRPEIEVGVLGPLEIRGLAAPPQRSKATELIVWLVLHGRHGSTDEVATALWPMGASGGSQHNVIWDARRALGEDADGNSLLVRAGELKLSPLVTSDWARFRELATCDDRDMRVAALSLVRGKPFGDVDWPWSTIEGLVATMEAEVCDLASAIGEQALLDGDASLAANAAEQGILASPYDERLYRLLMRASDALGNPAGIRSAMGRLAAVLEDDVEPLESVHPETRALYEALMRRRRPDASADVMAPRRSSGSSARPARGVREPEDAKPGVATDLDDHRRRFEHRP